MNILNEKRRLLPLSGYMMGGGGSGGGGQTTSTTNTSNIPAYAQPYVETMLGATQKQLFNTSTDESGNTSIDSFKPYQAYGGTYDAQGNQTAYDPGKAVAGFQPMQEAAQQGIANMQVPGQMGLASDATTNAMMRAANMGYGGQQFGNAYQGIAGYNPGQYNQQSINAPDLNMYQMQGPQDVRGAQTRAAQTNYAPDLNMYQMGGPQQVGTQQFTGDQVGQYMNPYLKQSLDPQLQEIQRQYGITGAGQQSAATQAGAFGGSREAIMAAENERNKNTTLSNTISQGYNNAFQNAQQQFNAQQQANLQAQQANQQAGLTTGQTNLNAALGVQGLGAQYGSQMALANLGNQQQSNLQNAQMRQQANLANQQAGLTTGQANLNAAMGIQGLGAGQNLAAQQANQQTNLATQQAQQQANQFGYGQAANQAQLAAQYGLGANQLNAQQQQFGANFGMNALQAQLAAANQLGNQGQQQLAAQQGIYGLQNQIGGQQQALEQAKINQAMTDYANAQQYPLMQLGTMSNMLRGLPMQASTTNQYAAAPSALSQGIGAAGAYAGLTQAGVIPKAEGGAIKSMAAGGITSVPRYDVGGEVFSDLEKMSPEELKEQAKSSSSKLVKQMAQSLLKQQRPPSMAGGGIIAFAKGGVGAAGEGDEGEAEAQDAGMQERLAQPPVGGGIMGAAPAPATPVPAPMSKDAFVNAQRQQAEQLAIANKPLEQTMAEQQKLRESMGVGSNQPAEDYRAKIMAERANSEDEAKRQKGMRMAEFFASWGSTPGPVLVAGMSALKKSIPGLIEDEKAVKKANRESDKIIYDIDHATRLEKLGRIDEAMAIKDKAAKAAQDLNHYILQYQASIEGHKLTKEGQIESANIHKEATLGASENTSKRMAAATAAAADRADRKMDETQFATLQRAAMAAKKGVRDVDAAIAKEKTNAPDYTTAKRIADTTRGVDAKQRQAALDKVSGYEAEWKNRRDAAKDELDLVNTQLTQVGSRIGLGGKKQDNETKAAPKERPPLTAFQN